jgi:hypothetical protein
MATLQSIAKLRKNGSKPPLAYKDLWGDGSTSARIALISVILDLKRYIFGHHTGILKFTDHILGNCVIK